MTCCCSFKHIAGLQNISTAGFCLVYWLWSRDIMMNKSNLLIHLLYYTRNKHSQISLSMHTSAIWSTQPFPSSFCLTHLAAFLCAAPSAISIAPNSAHLCMPLISLLLYLLCLTPPSIAQGRQSEGERYGDRERERMTII